MKDLSFRARIRFKIDFSTNKERGLSMNGDKSLSYFGITRTGKVFHNLSSAELVEQALSRNEGILASNGALNIPRAGDRTGRSPKDRFIVDTPQAKDVDWGSINRKISVESWNALMNCARSYLQGKDIFVFDGFAGADKEHRIQVKIVAQKAWHGLFSRTLFINPRPEDNLKPQPDFTVINACEMRAPEIASLNLNSDVFILVNFEERIILIGGTQYGGEIKKGVFSIMNYLLPPRGVFPMHCSANVGGKNDVALFFGLSGTGKTTLSADPSRRLIGDDEHGWTDRGVFNFEGGCYAKCIKLSQEAEPQIFNAIRFGSVLENVVLDQSRRPDYDDGSITENTRATYPTSYIDNCIQEGFGGHPSNVFFLAADAFGVLPPISKLSANQAMYHFLSGYTAKLAGTEAGINEPTTTFSSCFGAPFMIRHPFTYAQMLGDKMKKHGTKLWLINTGWSGGGFGVGSRMKIAYTRSLLAAALDGRLDSTPFKPDPIFGVMVPESCPGVPAEVLTPRNTWADKNAFDKAAAILAEKFTENFNLFADKATPEVIAAGPKVK